MNISRSSDVQEEWVGGISLFTGRPNPKWVIMQGIIHRFLSIWDALEPWEAEPPTPPPGGYRGCFLRAADREWYVYLDFVVLKSARGREFRRDRQRAFERLLLSSAPAGMIPGSFLNEHLKS